jgi:aldose 1-epimerase
MASSQSAVELLPLGAIIKTFQVGGRNIVLGFNTPAQYQEHNVPYFGETIGRVANRIKEGKIKSLNGKSYNLAVNNGPNHLHGGNEGWGKRIWKGPTPIGIRAIPGLPGSKLEGGESVRFTLRSEDGDEGYPGAVEATVVYTTGTQKTDDGKEVVVLAMEYEAQIVDDTEETVINMTNHSLVPLL